MTGKVTWGTLPGGNLGRDLKLHLQKLPGGPSLGVTWRLSLRACLEALSGGIPGYLAWRQLPGVTHCSVRMGWLTSNEFSLSHTVLGTLHV